MSAISAATVVSLTDKLTALWLAALGTDATGYGLGTSGASGRAITKASDPRTLVLALADFDLVDGLLKPSHTLTTAVDAPPVIGNLTGQFLDALEKLCKNAGVPGVSSLDTFAKNYNL